MAYAIMGGLAVATVLTLVFIPALYVLIFHVPAEPSPLPEKPASDEEKAEKEMQPEE